MRDVVIAYFTGEKQAGLLLAGLGVLGLAAAALFFQQRWGLRSFAVTLAAFALIELGIGVGLYFRTEPQVTRLVGQLSSEPGRFLADESARMQRVQRNFRVILLVELSVIVVAGVAAYALRLRPGPSGVALALLINAAVLLAFDIVAERRGRLIYPRYTSASRSNRATRYVMRK
jgi:hypothetical protein